MRKKLIILACLLSPVPVLAQQEIPQSAQLCGTLAQSLSMALDANSKLITQIAALQVQLHPKPPAVVPDPSNVPPAVTQEQK